jgi:hypothetical protein
MKQILFAFLLLLTISAARAQDYYNVLKYGAKNDSTKLSTAGIAKAIDAASKVGGGTIYFPAGRYLTGPIQQQFRRLPAHGAVALRGHGCH